MNATGWSVRETGLITFPTPGLYQFSVTGASGVTGKLWIDNVAMASTPSGGFAVIGGLSTTVPNEQHEIRLDYIPYGYTPGSVAVLWTPPSGTPANVPAADLSPNYNLATTTHTDDSAMSQSGVTDSQVPASTEASDYGSNPWLGEATTTAIDPTGLNLRTKSTYEAPGTGWQRPLTSDMPSDAASGGTASVTSDVYYADTDTLSTATCGVPSGTHQYGLLKQVTSPTPAGVGATAIQTTYVYDVLGRLAGSKNSTDTAWNCTTYDARGRTTQQTYVPPAPATAVRTETSSYTSDGTATGDPLTTWVQDDGAPDTSNGRITTVADLLGRVTSYTDVWGTTTTTSYDLLSQEVSETSQPSGQSAATEAFQYDSDGDLTQESLNGAVLANATYNTNDAQPTSGDMTSVAYPTGSGDGGNGTSGTFEYDATGSENEIDWNFPAGSSAAFTDKVLSSQSGKTLQDTETDGGTPSASKYTYDAAGRLVAATIPYHQLTYGFGATSGCGTGSDTNAGLNGNRTSYSDSQTGGGTTSTSYCYDNADRLMSTTVTNPVSGADPVAGTNLTSSNLSYDANGNTSTLADQTLEYDAGDRHIETILASGSTVQYERDNTDRIVEMTSTVGGTPTVDRYSFTGDGDGPSWTLKPDGTVLEHTLQLVGDVSVSIQVSVSVWSLPNLHGDDVITTDSGGSRTGLLAQYDPFGNAVDPATHKLGTTIADGAVPDDAASSSTSYGWEGSRQRVLEKVEDVATVEMGARQYVPALGRFLSIDPMPGGNADAFNYPDDPVNRADVDGRIMTCGSRAACTAVAKRMIRHDRIIVGFAKVYGVLTASQLAAGWGAILKTIESPFYRRYKVSRDPEVVTCWFDFCSGFVGGPFGSRRATHHVYALQRHARRRYS